MTIVTKLPLSHLNTPRGEALRVRDTGLKAIRDLLRDGSVRFVIADVGHELEWQPESMCFDFLKRAVRDHLAEPNQQVYLADFPGAYAYFGSQWDDGDSPIVLLSKVH